MEPLRWFEMVGWIRLLTSAATMVGRIRVWLALLGLGMGMGMAGMTRAEEFQVAMDRPSMDRWMYPFNFQPGTRPVAPTYGSFDPRFDTRDAELLLGWDTGELVPAGRAPWRYLLRSVRVSVTSVAPNPPALPFVYDPTYDSYLTYDTNLVGALPDSDAGRPVEMYGVGFRGGWNEANFGETSPFGPLNSITSGNISIGTRHAYAAMHGLDGELIDIANHVGQRNAEWMEPAFEVRPWAVGQTTAVAPGEPVVDGARFVFDLDLADPLVTGYLQRGLSAGRLRLMLSSLSPAGQATPGGVGVGGEGAYPWWATKENLLYAAPSLSLDGVVVTDEDSDEDGLPDDWERFWWGHLDASAEEDADLDGAGNGDEWVAGTNPRKAESVLRVLTWTQDEQGRVMLTFEVSASRQYEVESSGNLGEWTTLTGEVTYPEPGMGRWREGTSGNAGEGPRFLRLRAGRVE